MQASTVAAQPATPAAQDELTRDMYALMHHLMRVSNLRTFGMIAELDLSFTQIKALCALDAEGEERSVKALAESMGVSLPAMSRAVDGLYERGLVDRQEDPLDRRMKRVRLTPAGRAMTDSLTAGRLIGIQEFLASLSDEEAGALARALQLILDGHEQIAEQRPARAASAKGARA
ncbi:MAG TPA: MarR family transcriptional regulator [Solirubrobacteraceae bacterium]|nr:MarR family transcriptional regulator [Solirubrobacteraceae bacterium]